MRIYELYTKQNKELLDFIIDNEITDNDFLEAMDDHFVDFWRDLRTEAKYTLSKLFKTTIEYIDDLYEYSGEFDEELLDLPATIRREFIEQYMTKGSGNTIQYMNLVHYTLLPRTTWLIHFSDHAKKIMQSGFSIGVSDIQNLAFTNLDNTTKTIGYNFATILGSDASENILSNNRYGKDAIIFQNSGVLVKHKYDGQEQVIFYGPDVSQKNMIFANREKQKLSCVYKNHKISGNTKELYSRISKLS
jgi:hypothetical protein